MTFGAEQCRALIKTESIKGMLPDNISNLCECIDNIDLTVKDKGYESLKKTLDAADIDAGNGQNGRIGNKGNSEESDKKNNQEGDQEGNHAGKQTCDCNKFLQNEELMVAIGKFKICHGDDTNLSGALSNQLKILTKTCYRTSLKGIIDSLGTDNICGVEMSSLKKKGQEMLSYMDIIGGTVGGALEFVEKIKAIFSSGKHFFSKLIEKFQGYHILLPILKFFRCIFCPTRNENKENYNEEQMKQLQEQYSRTLQTNAELNNYLLGYQNV
ncbi:hypothetical protein POVCU1_069770 [Plasmodium ovale curtisi]|uniref:Uncharacterized protein n=1 Tax=Plasmodium ovale curtisi TaxID=864141 RepID=A0A1A8X990_PLAOA|nr:hypothetical protein POVCU1_069770 [Plasmodium ovale curtisi]